MVLLGWLSVSFCRESTILSILGQIVYNIYGEFQDLRGWVRCGIVKSKYRVCFLFRVGE